jgi:Tol biopolymer transport system component
MNKCILKFLSLIGFCLLLLTRLTFAQDTGLGLFEGQGDIGHVLKPGSVDYNSVKKTYLIAGSGYNMWFDKDAFHFVWKKVSGDVSIAANIKWIGSGGDPHRKACVIIRQSLDAESPYADAALHGSGLTSLQYRDVKGDQTHEIQSNVNAPVRIKIEKVGDYVSMFIARKGEKLHSSGGIFRIKFSEPFYIGLGVCAHDSNAMEKAVFSNVVITNTKEKSTMGTILESTLETMSIESTDRKVVYNTVGHFEAPNWSRDGKFLLFNSDGKIYKIPVTGGKLELVNTGFADKCNNDHGISPDGKQLAISDQSKGDGKSIIYIVPVTGGTPKQITPTGPSYWHGWSPDGKTLAYCAERDSNFDIYTIPVDGGKETRLTTAPGLDDGPDYSPDGKYIYFNSERSGSMQIWRMNADGSEQMQVTSDEYNNWFAHPSPDGKWIVFLSYEKDVQGHPANKDVMLRLMPTAGGDIKVLAKLFGGQGTINVPSWSPDGTSIAFVSYQLVNP